MNLKSEFKDLTAVFFYDINTIFHLKNWFPKNLRKVEPVVFY